MEKYNESLVINQGKVVLKFSASWCVWCKRLQPVLDRVMEHYDSIRFIEVDIDTYEHLFDQYHLSVVPTLVLLDNGKIVDTLVNPQAVDIIEQGLEKLNG